MARKVNMLTLKPEIPEGYYIDMHSHPEEYAGHYKSRTGEQGIRITVYKSLNESPQRRSIQNIIEIGDFIVPYSRGKSAVALIHGINKGIEKIIIDLNCH